MKLRLSPAVRALNPDLGGQVETTDRRARVPRAGPDARVGLNALLRRGWSIQGLGHSGLGVRLYRRWSTPPLDTGEHPSLAEACEHARRLERAAIIANTR